MKKSNRNIALGTLIAAGVGYAAGLLTAPKSGKETRKDIQAAAIKAKKEAEKKLKTLHGDLNKLIDQAKEKSTKLTASAKKELDHAIDAALLAKKKVSEVLSAIHEGESDDKDLQKAIKDVNSAIEKLKVYIEKN
jgi:gas vesicle protein